MRSLIDSARAALDARLSPDADLPVALALSGGGDSMALLHLAADWCARRGRRLLALTVDHRLHPDSAAWTAFAGEAARAVGADCRALSWEGPKPSTGLPAAAGQGQGDGAIRVRRQPRVQRGGDAVDQASHSA